MSERSLSGLRALAVAVFNDRAGGYPVTYGEEHVKAFENRIIEEVMEKARAVFAQSEGVKSQLTYVDGQGVVRGAEVEMFAKSNIETTLHLLEAQLLRR